MVSNTVTKSLCRSLSCAPNSRISRGSFICASKSVSPSRTKAMRAVRSSPVITMATIVPFDQLPQCQRRARPRRHGPWMLTEVGPQIQFSETGRQPGLRKLVLQCTSLGWGWPGRGGGCVGVGLFETGDFCPDRGQSHEDRHRPRPVFFGHRPYSPSPEVVTPNLANFESH